MSFIFCVCNHLRGGERLIIRNRSLFNSPEFCTCPNRSIIRHEIIAKREENNCHRIGMEWYKFQMTLISFLLSFCLDNDLGLDRYHNLFLVKN